MRRLIVLSLTLSSTSAFLQSSIPPVLHSGAAERGYAALAERFDEKAAMDVVRFMDRSWRIAGNPGFNASIDEIRRRLTADGFSLEENGQAPAFTRVDEFEAATPGWDY